MFPQFQPLSFEENNPFMSGMLMAQKYQENEIKKAYEELQRQELQAKAPYFNDLVKAQLELAQAQPGHTRAQTGLYGAQANEINQLLGVNKQEKEAKTQEALIKQYLIRKILGGNNQLQPGQPISNMQENISPGQARQPENIPSQQFQNISQAQQNRQPTVNANQISYPQAAVASHVLGLPAPQIVDINGTYTAISPFGNIPVAQGHTEREKAFQTGLGQYTAKDYGETVEMIKGIDHQNLAIENIVNAITTNPEYKNVTGPIGSVLTRWLGTPEQQNLLGTLQSSSGEISLQIAPSLKGAFTGKDQTLINTVKANPRTDFPAIFVGKLQAQALINTVLKRRAEIAAELEYQGMTPHKAHLEAARQVPLDRYRSQINQMISPPMSVSIKNKRTGETKLVTIEEARKMGVKI